MSKSADIILSGIQPTGPLHIGNYLGSVRNFLRLQEKYPGRCFFMLADYHSITEDYAPKEKPGQILELAAEFMASGLEPEKCVIYAQSDVPEVFELTWIFNTITPISFLERMTQFKDKAERQKKNINVGLFDYPILQAADILLPKANLVPVGQDQIQHVELTRDIARFFNRRFGGSVFPEPKPLLTQTPKVMSLLNPERKMSKSEPGSFISMSDEPEQIARKISRAVTDTGPADTKKKSPGVANLFVLLSEFGDKSDAEHFEREHESGKIRYSELKGRIAELISEHFANFRAGKKEFLANPKKIQKILDEGAEKVRVVARETMREARGRIGIKPQ